MNFTLLNIYDHDRGRTISTYPSKAIDPTSGISRGLRLFTPIFNLYFLLDSWDRQLFVMNVTFWWTTCICQGAMVERGCLLFLGIWSHLWYIQMSVIWHTWPHLQYSICQIIQRSLILNTWSHLWYIQAFLILDTLSHLWYIQGTTQGTVILDTWSHLWYIHWTVILDTWSHNWFIHWTLILDLIPPLVYPLDRDPRHVIQTTSGISRVPWS
jgi:hypothetical protein